VASLGIQHFDAFLLACIALNLTPGLDTFYILTRSGREGRAVGVAAALGINAGCIVHTLAAVLGISAILMNSVIAFSVLKYLGAAYLVWIGLRTLLTRAGMRQPTVTRGKGLTAAFRQGMLTNVLNPKVALFFLASAIRLDAGVIPAAWSVGTGHEFYRHGHRLVDGAGAAGWTYPPPAHHPPTIRTVDGSPLRHRAAGLRCKARTATPSLNVAFVGAHPVRDRGEMW
jgi:threonine/homoserine/homoserine lactone efflux protein